MAKKKNQNKSEEMEVIEQDIMNVAEESEPQLVEETSEETETVEFSENVEESVETVSENVEEQPSEEVVVEVASEEPSVEEQPSEEVLVEETVETEEKTEVYEEPKVDVKENKACQKKKLIPNQKRKTTQEVFGYTWMGMITDC